MAKNPMIQGSIMELVSRRYQTDRCFLWTQMCRCKDLENADIQFDEIGYVADLDLDDWLYCVF